MQEIIVKNTEIIKINNEKFIAFKSNNEIKVEKLTKEHENNICTNILNTLYAQDIFSSVGYINIRTDLKSERYFEVYSQTEKYPKFYLKFIRPILDPSKYQLHTDKGEMSYFIYANPENSEFFLLSFNTTSLIEVKNIKDSIIEGTFIKEVK